MSTSLPFQNYMKHIIQIQDLIYLEFDNWSTTYTQPLFDKAKDFFQRPGKLLRPLVIVMISEQMGGNIQRAYASSAAVEIYHNASLIFDDIQDSSEVRSERPSMHVSSNC